MFYEPSLSLSECQTMLAATPSWLLITRTVFILLLTVKCQQHLACICRILSAPFYYDRFCNKFSTMSCGLQRTAVPALLRNASGLPTSTFLIILVNRVSSRPYPPVLISSPTEHICSGMPISVCVLFPPVLDFSFKCGLLLFPSFLEHTSTVSWGPCRE